MPDAEPGQVTTTLALDRLGPELIEAAPDALLVVDGNGVICLVNRQLEAIFGYPRAELLGTRVEQLLPERFRADHGQLRTDYQAGPVARPMGQGQVLYARRKDGSEFPAEISLSPLATAGAPLVMAAIRDVSERQGLLTEQARVLQQAAAAEARFRGLLEAAPDAVIIADPAGRMVLVNRQAETLTGYNRAELVGQPVELLLPEALRARHVGEREAYAAAPHARPMGAGLDLVARRKDGSEVPVEISLSPVETSEGLLISAAIRDVTARREAEAIRRWHAALLDLVPAAVIVRDASGAVTYWNRAATQLYGWTEAEAKGQVVHDLLQTHIADSVQARDAALVDQGRWEGEVVQRRKDGSRVIVWSHQTVQQSESGTVQAVLQINTDITRLKDAEQGLQEANEELARSNADLEQFAYVASHDLQEPLRMVASYTQLLARRYRGKLDSDADEFIGFAVDGAQRMQALIQDLLAYSRVGTQGRPLEPTDSAAVLAQVLTDLAASIDEQGATVTVDPLPTVLADTRQLHSLFLNLVGNALKYHGAEPARVHVTAERQGERWLFAVQDHGIGLESQYAERIFVLFQRLHTREEYGGTGIGLAICKKIVERHGGRIWVESAPGQGATFRFTLPAAD